MRGWVVAVVGLALAACGSSPASSSSSSSGTGYASSSAGPTSDPGYRMVVMQSLAFNPAVIHARVGDRIVWDNEDNVPHNVTYRSGPRLASSPRVLTPGTKFSVRVTQPGTIYYFCSIHPWMQGTIIVSP